MKVGQFAFAIGNPFGLDQSLTMGVISASTISHVNPLTYKADALRALMLVKGASNYGSLLDFGCRPRPRCSPPSRQESG